MAYVDIGNTTVIMSLDHDEASWGHVVKICEILDIELPEHSLADLISVEFDYLLPWGKIGPKDIHRFESSSDPNSYLVIDGMIEEQEGLIELGVRCPESCAEQVRDLLAELRKEIEIELIGPPNRNNHSGFNTNMNAFPLKIELSEWHGSRTVLQHLCVWRAGRLIDTSHRAQ